MIIYINELGHMTNMAAMPIYSKKTLKNLLLQNQYTDDLETWYMALSMQVLPRLLKLWPWVDLDLFYVKVKFGEKWKLLFFLETIAALGVKVA